MKIEDNFLEQDIFLRLQKIMMGAGFPWYYNPIIDSVDDIDKFQFVHRFYEDFSPRSEFIGQMNPILDIIKPISLCRIKANLLTRTSNIIENSYHFDMEFKNPEKMKQMAIVGSLFVRENFDVSNMVKKIDAVYTSFMNV